MLFVSSIDTVQLRDHSQSSVMSCRYFVHQRERSTERERREISGRLIRSGSPQAEPAPSPPHGPMPSLPHYSPLAPTSGSSRQKARDSRAPDGEVRLQLWHACMLLHFCRCPAGLQMLFYLLVLHPYISTHVLKLQNRLPETMIKHVGRMPDFFDDNDDDDDDERDDPACHHATPRVGCGR
jgi:hypothetical protein